MRQGKPSSQTVFKGQPARICCLHVGCERHEEAKAVLSFCSVKLKLFAYSTSPSMRKSTVKETIFFHLQLSTSGEPAPNTHQQRGSADSRTGSDGPKVVAVLHRKPLWNIHPCTTLGALTPQARVVSEVHNSTTPLQSLPLLV